MRTAAAVLDPVLQAAPPPVVQRTKSIRAARDLEIENAIVHIIDHRPDQGLVLSEAELPAYPGSPLNSYFVEQIENILQDAETAEAKFADPSQGAAQVCYGLLDEPETFLARSQELARALWDATGSDQRISPGSLIVCRFKAANQRRPFLALLKIDPTRVLLQSIGGTAAHPVVSLSVAENALPTARERLQKAAIVAPRGYTKRCDLLLLDRMVSKPAARFFAVAFLNAEPLLTIEDRTEHLYRALLKARTRLTPPLNEAEDFYLEQEIRSALAKPVFDSASWVEGLALPEPAKAAIAAELAEALDVPAFHVSATYAEQKMARTRIRGDCGILIEFETKFREDVFRLGPTVQRADGKRVTTVTLDIPEMRWVS